MKYIHKTKYFIVLVTILIALYFIVAHLKNNTDLTDKSVSVKSVDNAILEGIGYLNLQTSTTYITPENATYVVSTTGLDSNPGTLDQPFRTIQKAADLANAGDTVVILNGNYTEHVKVKGNGNADNPIVFQAQTKGGVSISGIGSGIQPNWWIGDDSQNIGHPWVTIKGIKFINSFDINNPSSSHKVVRASDGWKIYDCEFINVPFGINVRGNFVEIKNVLFDTIEGTDAHAMAAAGYPEYLGGTPLTNLTIENVTIRNVNKSKYLTDIPRSAVTKFLYTDKLYVNKVLSEYNFGPGFWLDYDNSNYTIQNSVFRNNSYVNFEWEGGGLWLEANPDTSSIGRAIASPPFTGKILNNYFIANSGMGIGIFESTNLLIENNYFEGNNQAIEFRNLSNREGGNLDRTLQNITVQNNTLCTSKLANIWANTGEINLITPPSSKNIILNSNKYGGTPSRGHVSWSNVDYFTKTELKSSLNIEQSADSIFSDTCEFSVITEPEPMPEETDRTITINENGILQIEAEEYSEFFDKSEGNASNLYRSDDVDIKQLSDSNYSVNNIEVGEWLTYKLVTPFETEYNLSIRYSSSQQSNIIMLLGNNPIKNISLPKNESFAIIDFGNIVLNSGVNNLKIEFSDSITELDYLSLKLITVDKNDNENPNEEVEDNENPETENNTIEEKVIEESININPEQQKENLSNDSNSTNSDNIKESETNLDTPKSNDSNTVTTKTENINEKVENNENNIEEQKPADSASPNTEDQKSEQQTNSNTDLIQFFTQPEALVALSSIALLCLGLGYILNKRRNTPF